MTKDELVAKLYDIELDTLTGTRPTIESDRTIATVSFPLKSAIQRKTEDSDVPVNGARNGAKIAACGADFKAPQFIVANSNGICRDQQSQGSHCNYLVP
ncbi:MAG: hypothetical protein K2H96_09630 [Muribaculaceae bacterium]|nr:hypothetical protein [Muribaculaceae bacterium]